MPPGCLTCHHLLPNLVNNLLLHHMLCKDSFTRDCQGGTVLPGRKGVVFYCCGKPGRWWGLLVGYYPQSIDEEVDAKEGKK